MRISNDLAILSLRPMAMPPLFKFSSLASRREAISSVSSSQVSEGLPFSGIDSYLRMKFLSSFLKKEDVRERFIIGLGEIISCQEFPEREYAKKHLEKGILDMVYAYLNYFDFSPRNDGEARKIFKQKTKLPFPLRAEKAKLLAKRLGMEML